MDFVEAREEFRRLGHKYFAGKLSKADYHAEVRGLRIQDEQGRRWRIDSESGTWQRLDNGRWITADPDGPDDEFETYVDDEDIIFPDEAAIPAEVIGAIVFVLLIMIAAAVIAYFALNAIR